MTNRDRSRTIVLLLMTVLLLPGCVMYVPLSEFEDAQGIPKGTFRNGATIENGYLYKVIRGKKEAESIAWFASATAAYGITDDIGIRYTTWYTALPILSCRVSLPMTVLRSGHFAIAVVPSGTVSTGVFEFINDNMYEQTMKIGSLSIPLGYHSGSFSIYIAPRMWRSTYIEGWKEDSWGSDGRSEEVIRGAVYRSNNTSVAFGMTLHARRFTMMPECVLHSVEGKSFATMGVRFGMDY